MKLENLTIMCGECSEDRRKKWQELNVDTPLYPGDFVKIGFDCEADDHLSKEWMWVRLMGVKDNIFVGQLYNDPVFVRNLTFRDIVEFTRDEISEHLRKEDHIEHKEPE